MQATNYEFNYDNEAKNIGLIVGISDEIYFCTLSRVSTVYVEKIGDHWVAWRENYLSNNKRISNYKIIANGSFELVMARTKNYLQYINKKRK
ncbi:pathogenicity island protein [Mammaliicoccus sciuri]|uniref:Pathogenicity island protein n=1 Tax=Mammaliicoccus sciuri TaxID=1296 RepID=A0AAJ4VIR0_MAMSC|nr:pathogenicity island protein [Mammaliicoccus sciuri]RTX74384.1 pathogenicity island protein [Mammaliicoccus sciuri]